MVYRWNMFQEFKYLGCVLDESGRDKAKCRRRVAGAIRYLANNKGL